MRTRNLPNILLLKKYDEPTSRHFQFECARDAIVEFGLSPQSSDNKKNDIESFDALWVPGGLEVRIFMTPYSADGDRIIPEVSSTIKSFFSNRKLIIAPCMALPIVLESISGGVKSSALDSYMKSLCLIQIFVTFKT